MATSKLWLPEEVCQGYDKVFGEVRNEAILRSQRSVQASTTIEMQYKVCQSMEEVCSTLQIDQSSFLHLFKASNQYIDGKLHFLNSLALTTHSLAIVVYAKVINGGHTITNASLSMATPMNPMEVEDFVRVFGDSYVSKVVMGAEYYASFTYYTMTREEKMELLAKMKADRVFAWGSGDASIDKKIAQFNSSCKVFIGFCQAMRGISGVALPEPTHLLDFVLKFPTFNIDMPEILHFESVGYEHVRGFQVSHFAPIIRNRTLIVEDPTFLSFLSQVKGLENDVQAIIMMLIRCGMYMGSPKSFLDEVKQAIKIDRAAIESMMQDYKSNVMKEVNRPTEFKSLDYQKRVQCCHWTQEQSVHLGGHGGSEHDYVANVREFIDSGRRIVSIQLRSGIYIDRITIKYNNNDLFDWGGSGGRSSDILHVPEGVYFSKIRIKDNGNFITYLEFVLTNGNSLSGGDVTRGGGHDITYEPYKAPNYHYFCGFQVRSGIFIDGVHAIFAKFEI